MEKRIRIIVAPLDWGLGHATRCIPIIRELLKQNAEVIVAADGRAAQLLREEFPLLTHIHLKGYRVNYSSSLSMPLAMAFQIPKIISVVIREHSQLKKIIEQYQPDAVISDNRYGLWNEKIYSVFITHQLMVKCPKPLKFLESFLHKIILSFVKRYNECWVPDVAGAENISGDLSHKYPLPANAKYIGWLSRFNTINGTAQKKYDLLILLSGTEPLRTELEKKLTETIGQIPQRTLLVRGVTEEEKQFSYQNNSATVSYLTGEEIITAMQQSDTVICRPGYSSLMDLAVTGKKAVLIPTPGQTEQEYLAEEMMKKKKYFSSAQKNFKLDEALSASKNFNGLPEIKFESAVSSAVELLLKKITAA